MCLMVYSPTGELIGAETFEAALAINPDGIGVMSSHGTRKFLGSRASIAAWAYLQQLGDRGIPYGLHFRLATHGDIDVENCHPIRAAESDASIMHNGVIALTAAAANGKYSDTLAFVEHYMRGAPGPDVDDYRRYYQGISKKIGPDNLLLIFHERSAAFTICNEPSGRWLGSLWFSNTDFLYWDRYPNGSFCHESLLEAEWSDEYWRRRLNELRGDWPEFPEF